MFVWRGLVLEKAAEKDWFSDAEDMKACKAKNERGRKYVLLGVKVEVATAILLAVISVVDEIHTNSQMSKIDPLNQPIASATATVTLLISGTNLIDAKTVNGIGNGAILLVGTSEHPVGGSKSWPILLFGSERTEASFDGKTELFLRFDQRGFAPLSDAPVRTVDKWDFLELEVAFIPHGTEIISGSVEITVNSTTRKFPIPAQKAASAGPELLEYVKPVTVLGAQ